MGIIKVLLLGMKDLSKTELKTIGRIWAGSMLVELDGGFLNSEAGLNQNDDASIIVSEAIRHGRKLLGGHPSISNLNEITEYVRLLTKVIK